MILQAPNEFSPECMLLHSYSDQKDVIILNNLLVAAKMLIAKNWKSEKVPVMRPGSQSRPQARSAAGHRMA